MKTLLDAGAANTKTIVVGQLLSDMAGHGGKVAPSTLGRRRFHGQGLLWLALLVWWSLSCDLSAAGVLYQGHEVHPTRILARLKPGAQPSATAKLAAGLPSPELAKVLTSLGLEVRRRTPLVPGLLLLDDPGAPAKAGAFAVGELAARRARLLDRMERLRASGAFLYVEPDYQVGIAAEPNDEAFVDGTLWGLRNLGDYGGVAGADINATNAWNITTGSTNVVVAVIDTGVAYDHFDLAAQMWRNPGEIPDNGVDDDGNGYVDDVYGINAATGSGDPFDVHYHGTHVAGTIGAAANDGNPHVGVAWQVRLMACGFLDELGRGNISGAIECIAYAVAHGAKILNNSWYGDGFSQAVLDAITAANSQGILFVACAGNRSRNTDNRPTYPACFEVENVISVGALARTDELAFFSNFGAATVDLAAPGDEIYSCVSWAPDAYESFSGTSQAAPHVAGVAALLCAQFTTNITVAELRQRLLESTTPVAALSGTVATGGRLDAFRALTIAPDGQLDGRLSFAQGLPLMAGSTTALHLAVTDVQPVNTALVTVEIEGYGPLPVRNDGVAPDVLAGDHIWSGYVSVPNTGSNLVFNYLATAPGKTALSNRVVVPMVVRPINDMFANRLPLAGSSNRVYTSNIGASGEAGEPMHSGFAECAYRSLWWSWTAPTTATVTISTKGSSFVTLLAAYIGTSLGNLVPLANDDKAGGGVTSRISFSATAGTTYQIAVDGMGYDAGDVVLTVSQPAPDWPVILQQPTDQFAPPGGSVTFAVQASGPPPLSYQWWFAGIPLPNATTESWTVSPTGPTQAGRYEVVITNQFGAVTSRVAQLQIVAVGNGFFDDFEPAADLAAWSEFGGEVAANHYGGAVSASHSLWFNGDATRSATTRPLSIPFGGEVGFWLRFGTTGAAPWEMPDLPDDGIVLEYSVDGGATYAPLATCDSNEFFAWSRRRVALPGGAYSPATLLRWRQLAHHGNNVDHWALDDVAVTVYPAPAPVQFFTDPASQTVEAGAPVTFAPVVAGTEPITFQWFKDDVALPGATNVNLILPEVTTNASGLYSLVGSNALGPVPGNTATLTVLPVLTLGEALDAPELTWTSGGALPWRGQRNFTHAGAGAAQSGAIAENQESWLETTVEGPGTLTFWGRVASTDNNFLEFSTNDVRVIQASGIIGWTPMSQRLAPGRQTLRWRYAKVNNRSSGQDCGWVDQVRFVPDSPTPPSLLTQPTDLVVPTDGTAKFTVTAEGAKPLHYLWQRNGSPIAGATLPKYVLDHCQLSDSGSQFQCAVSNALGVVTSTVATLSVVPGKPFLFAAPGGITIPDYGRASPYPSSILVSGISNPVLNTTVTLSNLNHAFSLNIDILLVAPDGQTTMLMSHCGSTFGVSNATLTFDNQVANQLPDDAPIASGTYLPTTFDSGWVHQLPEPAPPIPYGGSLPAFPAGSPNGTWNLFIYDTFPMGNGSLDGGWSLTITATLPLVLQAALGVSNTLHLSFESLAGLTYVPEYKTSLDDTHWLAGPSVVGTGSTMTLTNSIGTQTQRVYRLRMQ